MENNSKDAIKIIGIIKSLSDSFGYDKLSKMLGINKTRLWRISRNKTKIYLDEFIQIRKKLKNL